MVEKRLLYGGLNSDDDDHILPDGDYRYAINIRNSIGDKSSVGAIENVKGATLVSFNLPSGANKCIGSKYDEKNNRFIYFIYNSNSNHLILEYSISSGAVTQVMSSPALNFNRDKIILNANFIDDLLYFHDEVNPPRKINISRAKSGGYTIINEQVISAIQYAPNYSPTTQYGSDSSVTSNKVRNKVFQFRYAYVYSDNEISAASPISKVAIPPNQALYDNGGYYDTTLDNYIQVTVYTGNYLCKRIQVFVRDSNVSDWYLAKELDKSELGIGNDTQYDFNFFNDEVLIPVTQASINRPFDDVPLLVGAQSIIDGNRLVYSDVTNGFDNIVLEAEATPIYNQYPAAVTSKVAYKDDNNAPFYSAFSQSVVADVSYPIQTTSYTRTVFEYIQIDANTVNATDVWKIGCLVEVFNASQTPAPTVTSFGQDFLHSFPAGSTAQTIAAYFENQINNSVLLGGINVGQKTNFINQGLFVNAYLTTTASISASGSNYILRLQYDINVTFNTSSGLPDVSVRFRTFSNISSNIVEKTLMHNARYSYAIAYYDDPNRSGVCQITDNFDVNILPYSAVTNKGSVDMQISVNSLPPSWAKYWQILCTGNRSVSSSLQTDTGTVTVLGTTIKIYINTIAVYNTLTGSRSNLAYSWAKGDRVTFIKDSSDNFYSSFYDMEILSSDTDGGGQYITIQNELPITLSNGVLIKLYTPKLSQEQVFYWEVGEIGTIQNGYHVGNQTNQTASQPAISIIKGGDAYFRYRGYNIVSFIEDFSLSDFYTSNSWDKGRFNVVDKEFKQIRRYATSYYSEQFIPDTNINGLSTFYDTNFHEANKSYGPIEKTHSEEGRMLICQQIRTGFSLVNSTLLFNSDGTPNGVLGQQNAVLSEVNYYSQPFGIGNHPESFAFYGNSKYFIDPNNGVVLRLSNDGFTPISDYKYRVFFKDLFQLRKNTPTSFLKNIFGVFDSKLNEYVLFFEACRKPDELTSSKEGGMIIKPGEEVIPAVTVAFSENKNRWVTHYAIYPEMVVGNNIGLIAFKDGALYTLNTNLIYNNFFGVQYDSSIQIIGNENPSAVKFYASLFLESTDGWSSVITNPDGQESELALSDFELIEGVYYAAFLKDSNTPNISNPLIEGDDLRSSSINITLTNNNTSYVKMFAINIRYGLSEMTNK